MSITSITSIEHALAQRGQARGASHRRAVRALQAAREGLWHVAMSCADEAKLLEEEAEGQAQVWGPFAKLITEIAKSHQ